MKECYEKGLEHDPEHSGAWSSLGSIEGGLVNGQPYPAKECYILSPSSSAVRTDLFIIARRAAFVVEPHAKHASGEAQQNPSRRRGFFVGLRLGQPCEMQTNYAGLASNGRNKWETIRAFRVFADEAQRDLCDNTHCCCVPCRIALICVSNTRPFSVKK